jgi:hypothetical protein
VVGDLPAIRLVAAELAFAPMGIGGSFQVRAGAADTLVVDRGRRIKGVVHLEVWGADEDSVNVLASAVAERVAAKESDLSAQGFLRLRQSKWLPVEEVPLRGAGRPRASKQILAYEMIFEEIETVVAGPEGPIREIDVRIQPPIEESLDLKKA